MSVKINTDELIKILDRTPAKQNIMLIGRHGIGKSQILSDYYSSKGFKVVPLFLGQMSDPGDLIGLLNKNEKTGKSEFMPPYWFPTDATPVVLFLDELNRARPEVLQTIMDLALNRTLAGKRLPEGSRIISAVNNGEEYQLTDLDPALVSRFNVYEFVPTVSEWLLWAGQNNIDERIIEFISENNSFLDDEGTDREDAGLEKFADRRGWERVSAVINGVDELSAVDKKIIAGIVGMHAASAFYEAQGKSRIISAKEILCYDFEKVKERLSQYTTSDMAVINDSLFRFIENGKHKSHDFATIRCNLTLYYEFLKINKMSEVLAHFANMFTGTQYPQAVVFVLQECGSLYNDVLSFVGAIK